MDVPTTVPDSVDVVHVNLTDGEVGALPRELVYPELEVEFDLDELRFARNLRSAKRGAAGSPSGMTVEHLQPLLGYPRDL